MNTINEFTKLYVLSTGKKITLSTEMFMQSTNQWHN